MFDTEALYSFKQEYLRELNTNINIAELWT
jgi:hypothetical protein